MRILIFDTETTGLPKERNSSIYDSNKWPYIIQFSWMIFNTELSVIEDEGDYIIKLPSHIEISQESINIHKITRETSENCGYDIRTILFEFKLAINKCGLCVAHNIDFDKKIIQVEAKRNNIIIDFPKSYCTMQNSIDLCKLERTNSKGEKYFKFPKLSELHEHLFGRVPKNTHNAKVDIIVCLRCFYKIKYDLDLCRESREFRTLFRDFCTSSDNSPDDSPVNSPVNSPKFHISM